MTYGICYYGLQWFHLCFYTIEPKLKGGNHDFVRIYKRSHYQL
jgi:hypothetical protein